MVYQPREDSFLLAKQLKKFLRNKDRDLEILDMGTGSGILAKTALELKFKNILAADKNPEALKKLKQVKTIESDLFSNIKDKFDLVVFNPPYLPADKHDKEIDTTGGKQGDETILKFLKQVRRHLNKNGQILILVSSLTPMERIEKEIEKQNFDKKILVEKKLFFEKLYVWLLQT